MWLSLNVHRYLFIYLPSDQMQQPEHTQEYNITSRLWSAGSDPCSCDTVNSLLSEDEQEVLK